MYTHLLLPHHNHRGSRGSQRRSLRGSGPGGQRSWVVPAWSGHPRWLSSCSLYIPCLTHPCAASTHSPDWPSLFSKCLHTCPRCELVIILILRVKNPPAMLETWVRSLGWEDPLEKGKATHSSILACRIPWTIQSTGSQRVGHNWANFTCTFIHHWSWSFNTLATLFEQSTHWKIPWCWERLKAGGERATEDEMFGWHYWLNGHEFEQNPGDGEG